MNKIKEQSSNHSKTSRNYSSLVSSSNESDGNQLQKNLDNFSESYIKELSRKINEKTNQSAKLHNSENKETKTSPIKSRLSSSINGMMAKSMPAIKMNRQRSEDGKSEDHVKDEANPLINEDLLRSGDTTKKDPSIFDHDEKNKNEILKNSKNKPLNILKMIKHVSVAINKLRNRTQYRNLKFVTDEQTDLINDATYFSDRHGKNQDQLKMLLAENSLIKSFYKSKIWIKKTIIYRQLLTAFKYIKANVINKIGVIEPDHKLKMIFDFLIIVVIVFLFFLFPLQMSFDLYLVDQLFTINKMSQQTIYFLIMTLLSLDIILKFFTGYYENGVSVLQKDKIFKNYIKNHLIFDVVAFMPVFLISFRQSDIGNFGLERYNSFVKLSEFLIFFKVFEVFRALQTLEEMLHLNEQTEALFELFKLITKILLFCHILACCWHAVAYYSPYHNNMITEQAELMHANWLTKYLYFLYWTISIEKIEPTNNLELFFGFFALLGSEAVMGIIIEGIHRIIESLTRAGTERRECIKIINRYMMRKNIEYDIQVKVRKYLNFIYDQDSANAAKENELIDKLSSSLREEILIRANGNILKMVPMFYKNFSELTLRKLVFSMKQVRFYPEEIIFQEDDIDDRSIFLISDGEIEIFKETSGGNRLCIKKLKKGDCFGELAFFTDTNRSFGCISSNFSTVYAISRNDFINILKENPDDFEKFRMLSDKIQNYQCYEDLYVKCHGCNRNDHTISRCPFVHFTPQREFLICRHLFNKPTVIREPFKRKVKRTINSRANIGSVQRKMKDFLSSLNLDLESADEFSESDSSDDDENFESSGSAVVTSLTKVNSHKKVSVLAEPMPSSGVIKSQIRELSSVVEMDKDEDENTNAMSSNAKEKSYEKKMTSTVAVNEKDEDNLVGHHMKRATIRTNNERDATYKHEKSMDRELSRKYSVYPGDSMEGKTAFSRGEREKTTKIQSGVYPVTSILNENKNDMYLKEMDKMTMFSFYFPLNNCDNVLKNLKYKRLARKSTKYAKLSKSNKASKKTRKSTKNLAQELSKLGLAIRLPSLNNNNSEMKDPSFLVENGSNYSPHKSLRPKKSFFTENEESPKNKENKK